MAGPVSASIFTLFVIASLSLTANSLPMGCKKMVGFLEDGIPGEYVVKASRGVKPHHIVQLMLQLSRSGCEGKTYRTSNVLDAPMKPMTCSNMIYIESFGFAAKMSDAAVMWLCDMESVEYIEPSYPVTLPTQPSTPTTTDDAGSGDSSGIEIVPDNIQPTTATNGATASQTDSSGKSTIEVTTTPTTMMCSKLRGELLPVNNYLIMFQRDLPHPRMNELYDLLKSVKEADEQFDLDKMKVIFRGAVKGFYYDGLNKETIMMFCESSIVDYIQVSEDGISTTTPQPTTTTTTTAVNPIPTTTLAMSVTPTPAACNKMVKYEDKTGIIPNRYILMLKNDTSQEDMKELIKQLKSVIIPEAHNSIEVKNVIIPVDYMKMIIVEINQAGLEWICQNSHVEKIDYDKAMMQINTTSELIECKKLRGSLPKSGSSLCRIYMTKSNSKEDCSQFIGRMEAMNKDPDNTIQFAVTSVSHHKERPMIKAVLNKDAIDMVCQSEDIESIITLTIDS